MVGVVLIVVVPIAALFAVVRALLVVPATFVAPTVAGNVAAFVTAAVPATATPASAPLTTAGVGAELMEEFTVDCGFAASAGL